jgi:small subunit ribosomal protein S23e
VLLAPCAVCLLGSVCVFVCVFVCLPVCFFSPPRSKPRGLRAARKLRSHRREQLWADKDYKKVHLGTRWKANPFGGASHAKGIVVERIGIEAKQPNSAIRKCCRVQLIKNGKKIAAFVPLDGCLNFVEENDEVLVAGFGRRGHAVGDIPGVRFKIVKVSNVGLLALFRGLKEKPRS